MVVEGIFTFGSGGHSTEMLLLLQNSRLKERDIHPLFVVSEDDKLICPKLEGYLGTKDYDLIKLTRGRKVGQSYFRSINTVLLSLMQAIILVMQKRPRILVTNGPAISVIMCLAIRLLRLLTLGFMYECDIIYVESFCRTKSLSLSGNMIYKLGLANEFYVQWPRLKQNYPGTIYTGLLV